MRGKKRTTEEQHELFGALEHYLSLGFSLKKACGLANVPYSSMRDIVNTSEGLRAYTSSLQNQVNTTARAVVAASVEKGNISDAKWWLQHFDHLEPQISSVYGGEKEMELTYFEHKAQLEEEEPNVDRLRNMTELIGMIKENRS
jgi:hypothetical protein